MPPPSGFGVFVIPVLLCYTSCFQDENGPYKWRLFRGRYPLPFPPAMSIDPRSGDLIPLSIVREFPAGGHLLPYLIPDEFPPFPDRRNP
jgi:hypothetical protein